LEWDESAEFFFQDIESSYQEFHTFACKQYDLVISASEETALLSAQAAVMPRLGRNYPYRIELPHDILAYFQQVQAATSLRDLNGGFTRLGKLASGELKITPKVLQKKSIRYVKMGGHSDAWELPSKLRFY
jgi:hypothetical protein